MALIGDIKQRREAQTSEVNGDSHECPLLDFSCGEKVQHNGGFLNWRSVVVC